MRNIYLTETIFGKGVKAKININKGEKVLDFLGQITNRYGLPYPYTSSNDYYLQIGIDRFLGPSGELDDYVNHSCDPNAGIVFSENLISLVAIKPILKDKEIFYDYSTTMYNFGWKMKCFCKSKNCRKLIDDFLCIPYQVQQKYIELGIIPEYILTRYYNYQFMNEQK